MTDRRARRTRASLFGAAVRLVTERGTTAIPISDLAEAADVSRQVVYQHFTDRDGLLLECVIDLMNRELIPRLVAEVSVPQPSADAIALASVGHFAEHRPFYRALLTGSCAHAVNGVLADLFRPFHRRLVADRLGDDVEPELAEALTTFLTAGDGALIGEWVITAPDPLVPAVLAARIAVVQATVLPAAEPGAAKPGSPATPRPIAGDAAT